ncbi:unnamed protein product [Ranitomeya imitator]|uniref:TIMELESS-interacting protein n=1 Tax=Ranitomeya imitator TaxID=111125 RepID=A0ABN9L943_9NEOB|nr:unnamed protein product [Ranitomeya imitator]
MTTVAYLRHQGGTKYASLKEVAARIFFWAERNLLSVTAVHLRGLDNTQADFLSRKDVHPGEWSLNQAVFQSLAEKWGTPEVDLFANRQNAKVETFFSLHYKDKAQGIDAFSHQWKFNLAYAFPPIPMLAKTLQKIRTDEGGEDNLRSGCRGRFLETELTLTNPHQIRMEFQLRFLPRETESVQNYTQANLQQIDAKMMDELENDLFDLPDYEHTEDESFPPLPPPHSPGAGDNEDLDNGDDWTKGMGQTQPEEAPKPARRAVKRPQPKLDAQRLTSQRGLPALRHLFDGTKFKGKGHEAEDLKVLIRQMENWAHRLFPKLQFEDFLNRLETLGNKKEVQNKQIGSQKARIVEDW